MSIIAASISNCKLYKNVYFSLKVNHADRELEIRMEMLMPIFDTKILPQTYSILKKELPSIMNSKCFNEDNLSFAKEVKKTEVGHLFEHILLEYVSELKRVVGVKNPIHNGLTSWNWEKETQGIFHITLDVPRVNEDIVKIAIIKSSTLLIKILDTSELVNMLQTVLLKEPLEVF